MASPSSESHLVQADARSLAARARCDRSSTAGSPARCGAVGAARRAPDGIVRCCAVLQEKLAAVSPSRASAAAQSIRQTCSQYLNRSGEEA
eukprot:6180816-Pleurochrysis_carterae.AAC.3